MDKNKYNQMVIDNIYQYFDTNNQITKEKFEEFLVLSRKAVTENNQGLMEELIKIGKILGLKEGATDYPFLKDLLTEKLETPEYSGEAKAMLLNTLNALKQWEKMIGIKIEIIRRFFR